MFKIITNSPEQTSFLGEKIANLIKDNLVICLEGDLGAGKTLFTQGFCQALNVKETVTSPTFNLMNVYEGDKRIYHLIYTAWKMKTIYMKSVFMNIPMWKMKLP